MSHSASTAKEILDILVTLTDQIGFDQSVKHNEYFAFAQTKIDKLMRRVEDAEYQKGRDSMLEEIEEKLWIPCCHTSGMHDPKHFQDQKYICGDQVQVALHRFCTEMGINPVTKSDPDCTWCEQYPEKKNGEGLGLIQKHSNPQSPRPHC